MMNFRFIPDETQIPFLRYRTVCYAISAALVLLTLIVLPVRGLNFGIDFAGGMLIEVRMPGEAADLATMRRVLNNQGLGEVALQEFGQPSDVLIRVARQEGGETAQAAAIDQVRSALDAEFGEGISYRRVEFVGPAVSEDLLWAGMQAVLYSLLAILAYIWFRFEWQFGVGAIVATIHDVVLTIGMFELVGLEFNLASVAALLTIVGYSLNDTVVVYDRIRENLRRYKAMSMIELMDKSINDTLARTFMTSFTTLLALFALFIFGGPVIRGFTFAMIWGILVGTYSSVFIAAPLLLPLKLRAETVAPPVAQAP